MAATREKVLKIRNPTPCVNLAPPLLIAERAKQALKASGEMLKRMKSTLDATWFVSGLVMGLTGLTLAKGAVPLHGRVSDDTALYQNLSEIRVGKTRSLNTESEIARLASLEHRYPEGSLPRISEHQRVRPVLDRISKTHYRSKKQSKEDRELDQLD